MYGTHTCEWPLWFRFTAYSTNGGKSYIIIKIVHSYLHYWALQCVCVRHPLKYLDNILLRSRSGQDAIWSDPQDICLFFSRKSGVRIGMLVYHIGASWGKSYVIILIGHSYLLLWYYWALTECNGHVLDAHHFVPSWEICPCVFSICQFRKTK